MSFLFILFIFTCFSCSKDNENKEDNIDKTAKSTDDGPKKEINVSKSNDDSQLVDLHKEIEKMIEKLENLKEENKRLKDELVDAQHNLKEKDDKILMNEDVIKKRKENENSLFLYISVLSLFLAFIFVLLSILFIKIAKRKMDLEKLARVSKELQNKIKNIETSKHSSKIDSFSSSLSKSSLFGTSKLSEDAISSLKSDEPKEDTEEAPSFDLISSLYNDKKSRDERKISGEADVFLDIAQLIYIKMQRNEKITTVILEKQGTWRNSMFVLIGQSLYLNFYSYNETRPFSLESKETEELMHLIYDIEGVGNVIRCEPAIVNIIHGNYSIITKGKLLLA